MFLILLLIITLFLNSTYVCASESRKDPMFEVARMSASMSPYQEFRLPEGKNALTLMPAEVPIAAAGAAARAAAGATAGVIAGVIAGAIAGASSELRI